jgi:hypothetical protein
MPQNPQTTQSSPQLETNLLGQLLEQDVKSAQSVCGAAIFRGTVAEIWETGEIVVAPLNSPALRVKCEVLETAMPFQLRACDAVLVICLSDETGRGIIIGRLGRGIPENKPTPAQEFLILEATKLLRLQCGESAVELRKDGKIIVFGKDVIIRAKRSARIKGASVAIN